MSTRVTPSRPTHNQADGFRAWAGDGSAGLAGAVGPWELVFMPLTDRLGGLIAYALYRLLRRKRAVFPAFVYAVAASLAVAAMLTILATLSHSVFRDVFHIHSFRCGRRSVFLIEGRRAYLGGAGCAGTCSSP